MSQDPPADGGDDPTGERTPTRRRTLDTHTLMEMLLAGHNMHRLEGVEIVEPNPANVGTSHAPPSPGQSTPGPNPTQPSPGIPATPEYVSESTLQALALRLQTGERWAQEPDHPLEGLTVASRLRSPPCERDPVDAEDLHGVRQANLEQRLLDTLEQTRARGHRFVRIITGRGLRSAGGYPVLRYATALWLARACREGRVAEAAIEGDLDSFGSFLIRLPRPPR